MLLFTDPGTCFVCDECFGEEKETEGKMDCEGYPLYVGSSKCISTTANTLISLFRAGDTESVNCLGRWLLKIMNFNHVLLTKVSKGKGNEGSWRLITKIGWIIYMPYKGLLAAD